MTSGSSTLSHRRRSAGDPVPRIAGAFWAALFLCLACLIQGDPAAAQTKPDWTQYNVPFPAPPADGVGAAASLAKRANKSIEYLACALENSFLETTLRGLGGSLNQNDPQHNYEHFYDNGYLAQVMAKLQWLKLGNNGCNVTFTPVGDFYDQNDFSTEHIMEFRIAQTFGSQCNVTEGPPPSPAPPNAIESILTANCLKAQVNFAMNHVQEGDRYPGTDPLPCYGVGSQRGDWDARMIYLIRILFLDAASAGDTGVNVTVLDAKRPEDGRTTRDYVLQDLITVDGAPGQDVYGYSILGCGDNEKDTGTAQDREQNGESGDGISDIGDLLKWLFRHIFGAIPNGVAAAAVAASGFGDFVGVIGLIPVLVGDIPETENHLLMIESTRFLNNQVNIETLDSSQEQSFYLVGGQNDVKSWLLREFQDIAKNDFREYNSRPYQQYTIPALRNLADFSHDDDVRTAAQMLLEYSAAKFGLGSNQGRRLVPFRRRLHGVSCILGQGCDECYFECQAPFYEIFNPKAYQDFGVSVGLLLSGQTQQLLNGMAPLNALEPFTATSKFKIDPLITDLGIGKDASYLQRFHHAGYEIYSSSRSALITAGGIETDHANHFMVGPLPIPYPPGLADTSNIVQDLGAGLPTTVMFTGDPKGVTVPQGQSRMSIEDFIQIQGNLNHEDGAESFTDNLCVWRNFACGINFRIPPDIVSCLVGQKGAPVSPVNRWYFLDSSTCLGYKQGPSKFYVVLYLICGQDTCFPDTISLNPTNAGFLEIVESPTAPFDAFQATVLADNPPDKLGDLGPGCLNGGDCKGKYQTYRFAGDHVLELELRGHQDDSDKTGVTSVDGVAETELDDRPLAEGDIVSSQGDGAILIRNPRLAGAPQIVLDFRDANHPCRRIDPGHNCLPPQ
jgi:hypothetical protein